MLKNTSQILHNENGSVIVVGLMVLALVSLTSILFSDRLLQVRRANSKLTLNQSADRLNQQILSMIYNDRAWAQTAGANTCMLNGESCGANPVAAPVALLDNSGAQVTAPSVPTQGFNLSAQPCNNFSNSNGNDACPFRYELDWLPTNCTAGKCDVRVNGTLLYRPANPATGTLNTNRFTISVIRGREGGTLQSSCWSMNGVFDQATNTCTLGARQSACPDGQFLSQASNSGNLVCLPLMGVGIDCPAGSAAVGILANGSLDCRSDLDW